MASIVVVDGGSSFGAELVGRLFGAGRDVLVAPTIDVALERIARFPPEVVFVFHDPPVQDGAEIARAARAADERVLVIVGGQCAPLDPIPGVNAMFSPALSATNVARAIMVAADERTQSALADEAETPPILADELVDTSDDIAPVGPDAVQVLRAALESSQAAQLALSGTQTPSLIADDVPDVTVRPRAVSTAGAPRWTPGQFDRIAESDLFLAPSASPLDASFFRDVPEPVEVQATASVEDALCGALVSEIDGTVASALVDLDAAALVGLHYPDDLTRQALESIAPMVVAMFNGEALARFEDVVHEEGAVQSIVVSTVVTHHILRGIGERFVVVLVAPTMVELDPLRERLEALLPGLHANLT